MGEGGLAGPYKGDTIYTGQLRHTSRTLSIIVNSESTEQHTEKICCIWGGRGRVVRACICILNRNEEEE